MGDSLGARFLGWLLSSTLGAPCCAPVALALGAQSAAFDTGFGAITLAAFGAGQVLPLAALAAASRVRLLQRMQIPEAATSTISGTLLVAMGGLYGVMA
ncbi:MAG: hypothetical protein ACREMT_08585, partial [Vulcanimicrobiaceae bacterium]